MINRRKSIVYKIWPEYDTRYTLDEDLYVPPTNAPRMGNNEVTN